VPLQPSPTPESPIPQLEIPLLAMPVLSIPEFAHPVLPYPELSQFWRGVRRDFEVMARARKRIKEGRGTVSTFSTVWEEVEGKSRATYEHCLGNKEGLFMVTAIKTG
jgi:hypothetical protein